MFALGLEEDELWPPTKLPTDPPRIGRWLAGSESPARTREEQEQHASKQRHGLLNRQKRWVVNARRSLHVEHRAHSLHQRQCRGTAMLAFLGVSPPASSSGFLDGARFCDQRGRAAKECPPRNLFRTRRADERMGGGARPRSCYGHGVCGLETLDARSRSFRLWGFNNSDAIPAVSTPPRCTDCTHCTVRCRLSRAFHRLFISAQPATPSLLLSPL